MLTLRCLRTFLPLALALAVFGCSSGSGDDDDASDAPDDSPTPPLVDSDGDGSGASDDCNDGDPSIYPGATERCDAKDNDCDGQTDEGATTAYYYDQDGDQYGVDGTAVFA